jgi:hypothetical protein
MELNGYLDSKGKHIHWSRHSHHFTWNICHALWMGLFDTANLIMWQPHRQLSRKCRSLDVSQPIWPPRSVIRRAVPFLTEGRNDQVQTSILILLWKRKETKMGVYISTDDEPTAIKYVFVVICWKHCQTFLPKIQRVLTMVYNIQNYRVSGLCPSSGILNTWKRNVSETGSISVIRWGERDTYSAAYLWTS